MGFLSVHASTISIKEVGTQAKWRGEGTIAFKRGLGPMSLGKFTEITFGRQSLPRHWTGQD